MQNIDALIATSLHTADAESRLAAADAAFATHFVTLTGDAQARCWRGLDHGAKFRLVVRRIEALGLAWMPSTVLEYIAKYDARFALGPVEAAVEGALERLSIDNGQHAATADTKEDRAFFRRATTAFTNALIQYRAGVRPALLASGAWLLPSRRAGEAPHIVRMDGDWTCSCRAGHQAHWATAMLIAIEVSHDDLSRFDDGDVEIEDMPTPAQLGARLCAARSLAAA